MPFSSAKKAAKYQRAYREENAEHIAELKHLYYQRRRTKMRAIRTKNNRKAGAKARPKGSKAKPEIEVPISRRWRYLNGRLYFTSLKGFDPAELRVILKEVAELIKQRLSR